MVEEGEIGGETTVDEFVRQQIERDDRIVWQRGETPRIVDRASGGLRGDMKAARVRIGCRKGSARPVHFLRTGRGEFRDLLLVCRALMQQPELQPIARDGAD